MVRQKQQRPVARRRSDCINTIEHVRDQLCEPLDQSSCGGHQLVAASSLSASRAARRPVSTSTLVRSSPPTMKNATTARIAFLPDPLCDTTRREHRRSEDAGELSKTAKKPKNSDDLCRGIMLREERPAQRLAAALHHADQHGERKEMPVDVVMK